MSSGLLIEPMCLYHGVLRQRAVRACGGTWSGGILACIGNAVHGDLMGSSQLTTVRVAERSRWEEWRHSEV